MRVNCMKEDWTKTYRPRTFEELWSIESGHRYLMGALRTGTLARAILLMGTYGVGKSTTARMIAQALSCHNRSDHNPCGRCDGCEFCDTPMMGLYGSAIFIQGNRYDGLSIRPLIQECNRYAPANVGGSHVVIIDEAHHVPQREQEALLDIIEDSDRTNFILCTTHAQKVIHGIRHRCTPVLLNNPSIDLCVIAAQKIAALEELEIDDNLTRQLCLNADCNPRTIIQHLMYFASTGELPEASKANKADLPSAGLM